MYKLMKLVSYYKDSLISLQVIYKKGQLKFSKEFLSDGQIVNEGFYKDGEKQNTNC